MPTSKVLVVFEEAALQRAYLLARDRFDSLRDFGVEIRYIQWGPESIEELQRINRIIEEKGSSEIKNYFLKSSQALSEATFVVVQFYPVSKEFLKRGKNLQVVGVLRAGYENIDVKSASNSGILVINTPGRNANIVAEFTIGLLLAESKNIARSDRSLHKGLWRKRYPNSDFISDLAGKTVGIIGFGNVGRLVAKKLSGFEVKIIGYDPYVEQSIFERYNVKPLSLEEVLHRSDFICVNARLTEETKGLIGAKEIALMKPTSYLINTARADLVDEEALLKALQERKIAGAALDVFSQEPLPANSPFLMLDNVTLTPHIAGTSIELVRNSANILVEDLKRYLKGETPKNLVNPDVWRK